MQISSLPIPSTRDLMETGIDPRRPETMTFSETTNFLNTYVDGELDATRSQTVETHLQQCATCLIEVESLQALASAFENGSLRFNASSFISQVIEQCLCFTQVHRVEPLGERAVNLREETPCFFLFTLVLVQARHAHHST